MGDFSRKADGRRVFTAEFKRTPVERIRNDERTMASGFDLRWTAGSRARGTRRGQRFGLRVIDVAGRKHLPIVELKKAASHRSCCDLFGGGNGRSAAASSVRGQSQRVINYKDRPETW